MDQTAEKTCWKLTCSQTSNIISYLLGTRHVAQNGDVAELCLQRRREARGWGAHLTLYFGLQTANLALEKNSLIAPLKVGVKIGM